MPIRVPGGLQSLLAGSGEMPSAPGSGAGPGAA
jgi:hypothetical protein